MVKVEADRLVFIGPWGESPTFLNEIGHALRTWKVVAELGVGVVFYSDNPALAPLLEKYQALLK